MNIIIDGNYLLNLSILIVLNIKITATLFFKLYMYCLQPFPLPPHLNSKHACGNYFVL